jgi:hypothetical protein
MRVPATGSEARSSRGKSQSSGSRSHWTTSISTVNASVAVDDLTSICRPILKTARFIPIP